MINQETGGSRATERRSIALSGMILGIVGFLSAFIHGWRMFAVFICFGALIVSALSMQKAIKYNKQKIRQMTGLLCSIAGIIIASYFLYTGPRERHILEGDKMPVNVQEDGIPGSKDQNLEEVKEVIDSTYKR